MYDKIHLVIGNTQIDDFISYQIESDLFQAASTFSFEFGGISIENRIFAGAQVQAYINKSCILKGIIDRISVSYSKDRISVSISGRNRMGLLCDRYCEDFGATYSLNGKTINQIAEHLIREIPYISRDDIIYEDGAEKYDKVFDFGYIEIGETVFEVLKRYATNRGLIFYYLPDGTFAFGKPKINGKSKFQIICKKRNPTANNSIEATLTNDISQCYSRVTVVGQIQEKYEVSESNGQLSLEERTNVTYTANQTENIVPFDKPMMVSFNNDAFTPKREASRLIEQQRAESLSLEYDVVGHSQNGNIWRINELCYVDDDVFFINDKPLKQTMLIRGCTFSIDKKNGAKTHLCLGYPGISLPM